jgi:FkbM family methyltransferase
MQLFYYIIEKLIVALAGFLMKKNQKEFPKMAVISGDYVSLKAMLQGRFENQQLAILEEKVFPKIANKTICLDIGANIGNHSVSFAKYFGKVISFEPNPMTFDVLNLNSKWNKNIFPIPLGASNKSFTAFAKVPAGNLGAAEIIHKQDSDTTNTIEFTCIRIDEYLEKEKFQDIGFIKIDVEGHEYEALEGCQKILTIAHPVIVFELLRKDFKRSGEKIFDFLKKNEYSHFYEINKKISEINNPKNKNYKMIAASRFPIL